MTTLMVEVKEAPPRMTKEQVKTISPKLAKNQYWHDYVESSWMRFEYSLKMDWQAVALGFDGRDRTANA